MNAHVVVVDDEPDLLEMIRFALEAEGFSVTSLETPTAEKLSKISSPDLFLIDLLLGTTHGVELAAWLRENTAPDVPMVGISASSAELQMARQSHAFEAVLGKPFDLNELVTVVSGCITR